MSFQWNGLELNSESSTYSSSSPRDRIIPEVIVKPIPETSPGVPDTVAGVRRGGLALRAKLQMSNHGDVIVCSANNEFGVDSVRATITVYDANERESLFVIRIQRKTSI